MGKKDKGKGDELPPQTTKVEKSKKDDPGKPKIEEKSKPDARPKKDEKPKVEDKSKKEGHFQRTRSRQLSIMLEKLYENREKSDYEAIVPDLSHLAKESVDLAQQALIFIESFWRPSSPP